MTIDSLGTNPQLTAQFVKFLNAQLQDCRDQLQRLNEVRLTAGMLVTRARHYECSIMHGLIYYAIEHSFRVGHSVYRAVQLTGIILQLPGECFPQANP